MLGVRSTLWAQTIACNNEKGKIELLSLWTVGWLNFAMSIDLSISIPLVMSIADDLSIARGMSILVYSA